jgi:hypothetical protein
MYSQDGELEIKRNYKVKWHLKNTQTLKD